jgi:hypothetical protein
MAGRPGWRPGKAFQQGRGSRAPTISDVPGVRPVEIYRGHRPTPCSAAEGQAAKSQSTTPEFVEPTVQAIIKAGTPAREQESATDLHAAAKLHSRSYHRRARPRSDRPTALPTTGRQGISWGFHNQRERLSVLSHTRFGPCPPARAANLRARAPHDKTHIVIPPPNVSMSIQRNLPAHIRIVRRQIRSTSCSAICSAPSSTSHHCRPSDRLTAVRGPAPSTSAANGASRKSVLQYTHQNRRDAGCMLRSARQPTICFFRRHLRPPTGQRYTRRAVAKGTCLKSTGIGDDMAYFGPEPSSSSLTRSVTPLVAEPRSTPRFRRSRGTWALTMAATRVLNPPQGRLPLPRHAKCDTR